MIEHERRREHLGDRQDDAEDDPERRLHTPIVTRRCTSGDADRTAITSHAAPRRHDRRRSARLPGCTTRELPSASRSAEGSDLVSLLPETSRRVDEIVARAQADGRVPSLVAAVVRDGALVHFAGAGEHPRPDPQDPVPDRLDHQDDDRRDGACSCATRAGSPSTTCSTGTCRAPRSAASRCASCSATSPACSASRTASGGSAPPAPTSTRCSAGWPRQARLPAVPRATTTPTWRTGCSAPSLHRVTGEDWADAAAQAAARPAGHAPHHVPRRSSRSPAGTSSTRGTARCARSRATTPARWPRPASSGRRSTDLVEVGGVPGRPDAGRARPATTVDEMCAPGRDQRPGRRGPPGTASAWSCGGSASGCTSGTPARCPATWRTLAVHRPSPYRRGGLRQRVHPARRPHRRARPADPRPRSWTASRCGPQPWRPAAAPPGEVAALCGRWWWMGREYDVRWDADAGELVVIDRGDGGRRAPWRFAAGRHRPVARPVRA